jgi:putative copper resistance protein D
MAGLAPIDAWTIAAILAKTAGYLAALLAMGGPLFVATFPEAPGEIRRLARRIAVAASLLGLVVLALRFGIRAARISGTGFQGAVDPMMLGFVWESPLGTAAIWRGLGELLVIAVLIPGRFGIFAGLTGALLIAFSFTFVGHSLGDPRWLLATLLAAHLLAVAFWVGALVPLHRVALHPSGAPLLRRFGDVASLVVLALATAGLGFAWLMTGSLEALIASAYGSTLLLKLTAVSALMLLAARNKWQLVPALASGVPTAAPDLRRAIRLEAAVALLILMTTATLTSITTPPVNL